MNYPDVMPLGDFELEANGRLRFDGNQTYVAARLAAHRGHARGTKDLTRVSLASEPNFQMQKTMKSLPTGIITVQTCDLASSAAAAVVDCSCA